MGTQLFSYAVVKTLSTQVARKINHEVAKITQQKITRESVNKLRVNLLAQVEAMPNIASLPPRRVVDVTYRGKTFSSKVNSFSQQVSLSVAAAWKGKAVAETTLVPHWAETMLLPLPVAQGTPKIVDDDMCAGARLARLESNKHFEGEQGASGAAMLQSLRPKLAQGYAADSDFAVEVMLMECLCGEGSAAALIDEVLAALPNTNELKDIEPALQSVAAIVHSNLYKLASKTAQTKVGIVVKWLTCVLDSRALDFSDALQDDDLTRVKARFQYFCSVEEAVGSSGAPCLFWGETALRKMLAKASEKQGDQGCKMEDIAPFKVFGYLVPAELKDQASALIKTVEELVVMVRTTKCKKPKKAGDRKSVV